MNESFIEAAMKTYGNTVLRVALSVTGNKSDADDIFADVFFALYKHSPVFLSDNHLKAWLIRVTVNKSKNVRLSAWHKKRAELTENLAAPDSFADNDVLSAMQKLKQKERAVVYLHYYEGYAFKEIAQILDMREGSVRSTASRARAALRELLSD